MMRRALVAVLLACLFVSPVALAQSKKGKAAPAAPEKSASSNADPVVARINGTVWRRSQLMGLKTLMGPQAQQQSFEQVYPQLLDRVVSMTLIEQAARKAKLEDQPMTRLRLQLAEQQVLQDAYLDGVMKKEITQDKLKARYDEYVKKTPAREEVNARHIVVATEAEAKDIIAELDKGADFQALAREKTTDAAGKASGGDLGWFAKEDMLPEFADAAFKLKKGEYSKTPVKTQFGWHVIKIEDRRQGKPLPYDQVAPKIAQQILQEVAAQRVHELAQTAKIEVFRPDGSPIPPPPTQNGAPAPGPGPRAVSPQSDNQAPTPGPTLSPLGGGADAPPGVPKLSPATAPGALGKP